LNNPFKYTDPSGEIIGSIIIGAMIGAFINVMVQGMTGKAQSNGQLLGAIIA
jgi:F0F1-type ATP synthase assembly protein I